MSIKLSDAIKVDQRHSLLLTGQTPRGSEFAEMAFLMRFCTLVVNVLCLPLHLMESVGLYQIYKRVFPILLYRFSKSYNKKMHDKKTELFRSLSEFKKAGKQLTLLEIGCGTGTNFKYYPPGCRVICADPNPSFQSYLKLSMTENEQLTYERFMVASGEDMGSVEDESVDVVVCTLVLCSVKDIPQTLREIHRILRPGGAFFFMEHVVANPSTWTHFLQHVLQPAWYYFADGCQAIRDTRKDLESAWFSDLKLSHVDAPLLFLIKRHIMGYAVK
ncbi:methyltransferase-like protein 7A [Cheilinus undulatus]|uniref:methyltransferase-like protein 7A n=1 Tax=Cheilinus undulatus TaxID=241271 RepID=UPI001BD5374E|nr:methyltransferase-like protein 7A [Cheilinus undulatus]